VADRLHWQVFDREILAAIARDTHTREVVLSQHDEHAIGGFDDWVRQLLVRDDPGRQSFLRQVVRVVWGVARAGNAVVVGRGANWFLDPRYGLRVRLVASVDVRVARVAAREGADPAAVRAGVLRNDAEQAAFIRQSFGRDIDDPTGYDLVVNAGAQPESAVADVLLAALHSKLGASVPR